MRHKIRDYLPDGADFKLKKRFLRRTGLGSNQSYLSQNICLTSLVAVFNKIVFSGRGTFLEYFEGE